MAKQRATDLKANKKVYLPKAMETRAEARLDVRQEKYRKTYNAFIKEACNKKGEQETNLTASQARGLKTLKTRISKGELLVIPTDKSKKMAVTTREAFLEMGRATQTNIERSPMSG